MGLDTLRPAYPAKHLFSVASLFVFSFQGGMVWACIRDGHVLCSLLCCNPGFSVERSIMLYSCRAMGELFILSHIPNPKFQVVVPQNRSGALMLSPPPHFCEQEPLKAGDLVKIELGCHVDYYSAVVGHTLKVCMQFCVREAKGHREVLVLHAAPRRHRSATGLPTHARPWRFFLSTDCLCGSRKTAIYVAL